MVHTPPPLARTDPRPGDQVPHRAAPLHVFIYSAPLKDRFRHTDRHTTKEGKEKQSTLTGQVNIAQSIIFQF